MEARTPGATRAGPGEHVFDMHKINRIMGGPGYSPVFDGCVEGDRMIVALIRYPAGNPGDVFYVPANKIHKAANNGDKDVVFFTCKDAVHGLHGTKAV